MMQGYILCKIESTLRGGNDHWGGKNEDLGGRRKKGENYMKNDLKGLKIAYF